MSTLLEPGECVRWKHDGGWKVGRVLHTEEVCSGPYYHVWKFLFIQCPEGIYRVMKHHVEPQPMRAEWEGEE